jgi:RHS repeat-associated protein
VLSAGTCTAPTTTVASYAYDAQGRRKTKTVGSTTTVYTTDADNREVLEYDGTSGALGRWYAYGIGPDAVLNQMNVGASTRETMIPDVQGSIIGTLDSGGALSKAGYQAFGENPALTSGTFQYTAQRFDPETAGSTSQPSGLYYYRSRMYSPTWGRFLQPDPIGYAAGNNLYAYVGNDPLNNTDPSGRCPWCIGAAIGFGVDFAAQAYIHYNQGKSILGSYDIGQGLAAAGAGALTAGASAFIGGAIEGGGALAIGARAVANAGLGAAVTAGQTAVLNNFDNHNDSYVTSLEVGGAFGAAGSAVGDVLTSGIQSLSQSATAGLSAGEKNFILGFQELNNINPAPAGVATGQAVGAVVGSGSSFVPLDSETAPKK